MTKEIILTDGRIFRAKNIIIVYDLIETDGSQNQTTAVLKVTQEIADGMTLPAESISREVLGSTTE